MSYCNTGCGGCGSGCYSPSSGLDSLVSYTSSSASHMYQREYHSNISASIAAPPAYSDSLNPSGFDYVLNLDAQKPQVISSGGMSFNYADKDKYNKNKLAISENYNNSKPTTNEPIIATSFINPWIKTKFIGEVEEIKEHIEQAFELTTGEKLPEDFTIELCDEERLKKLHIEFGGTWSPGIQGFAINKKHVHGQNHVFVKKGQLANVMAVIGHELGHIMSTTLFNKHDEEAKAYAFELAWLKILKEHNIANLAEAINLSQPAENGLHNVAFKFVKDLMQKGEEAISIFWQLVGKEISYANLT